MTVVFAWASLKMRKYRNYQLYMAITLLCAGGFLVIKYFEYKGKLTHWSLRMHDGSVVTGHVHHTDDDNIVFDEVESFKVDTAKGDLSYVLKYAGETGGVTFSDSDGQQVDTSPSYLRRLSKDGIATLEIEASAPLRFSMPRTEPSSYDGAAGSLVFRDGTIATGKLVNDSITLEVDAIDLQAVRLDKVKDGDIGNARIFDYLGADIRSEFLKHRDQVHAEIREKHPEFQVDTDSEVRRKALQLGLIELSDKIKAQDPHHDPGSEAGGERGEGGGHASVTFKNEDVKFYSNFSPRLNTYYAIYFLLTGLHGLHVIGGIIVLGTFFYLGANFTRRTRSTSRTGSRSAASSGTLSTSSGSSSSQFCT